MSVHVAEFPAASALRAWRDDELVARWEGLIALRDEVNRALEGARQAKTIGNSTGAHVTIRARGGAAQLLSRYRGDLPMLFIVSQLDLEIVEGDGAELEVIVQKAEGDKCPRCWRIVQSIDPSTGLCDRCTAALAGGMTGEAR